MKNFNHLLLILISFALTITGCDRASTSSSSSRIVIEIPDKTEFSKLSQQSSKLYSSSVSALAAVDYNSLCFVVNIKGPSIPSQFGSCNVERGITVGSVIPGSQIIIPEVPKGENYSFEIFGLLKANNADACPVVNVTSWNHPLDKVYLLGKTTGVTLIKQDEEVTINLAMPDQSNHMAAQNSFPSLCTATAGAIAPGNFLLGASLTTSLSFKLRSRVSYKEEAKELMGTTLKITRWKAGVTP
ncbi:MAG: hypothetical protein AABY53_01960 [Bdellovibrionota bacterium]